MVFYAKRRKDGDRSQNDRGKRILFYLRWSDGEGMAAKKWKLVLLFFQRSNGEKRVAAGGKQLVLSEEGWKDGGE